MKRKVVPSFLRCLLVASFFCACGEQSNVQNIEHPKKEVVPPEPEVKEKLMISLNGGAPEPFFRGINSNGMSYYSGTTRSTLFGSAPNVFTINKGGKIFAEVEKYFGYLVIKDIPFFFEMPKAFAPINMDHFDIAVDVDMEPSKEMSGFYIAFRMKNNEFFELVLKDPIIE